MWRKPTDEGMNAANAEAVLSADLSTAPAGKAENADTDGIDATITISVSLK